MARLGADGEEGRVLGEHTLLDAQLLAEIAPSSSRSTARARLIARSGAGLAPEVEQGDGQLRPPSLAERLALDRELQPADGGGVAVAGELELGRLLLDVEEQLVPRGDRDDRPRLGGEPTEGLALPDRSAASKCAAARSGSALASARASATSSRKRSMSIWSAGTESR